MAHIRTAVIATYGLYASAAVRAATKSRSFSIQSTFLNVAACVNGPLVFSSENVTAIQDTCYSPTPEG